jgi:ADP-ribose pyrophosphatase YjhB (NUDIX family)
MREIKEILSSIDNPKKGLPEEVFLFISQLTPMVNVELLIKDPIKGTLLTWRHDEFYGPDWHLPGGIIRFKELAETRVEKVAKKELNSTVSFLKKPIEINEIMNKDRDVRGHFLSLLYECKLTSSLNEVSRFDKNSPRNGSWCWFKKCPENLIYQHEIYRNRIGI